MMLRPAIGLRVRTSRFGTGVITRVTANGALVLLDRLPISPVEVPLAEMSAEGESQEPNASPDSGLMAGAEPAAPGMPDDVVRARRTIEALRFGVVPRHGVSEITVGYDALRKWVVNQLPSADDRRVRVAEVSGAFGTGKSHTMAAVRHVAVAEGYLVAHVEVNAADVSLSDPEGVLRQLWPTIGGQELESATPMLELHLQALDNGRDQLSSALKQFERVLANVSVIATLRTLRCLDKNAEAVDEFISCGNALTASQLQSELYGDIRAQGGSWQSHPIAVKRLIGQATHERPKDFVRCVLGYAALARRAGFRGLAITIDEFEVEYNLPNDKQQRVWALLDTLEELLPEAEVSAALFVATVAQGGADTDETVTRLVRSTGGDTFRLRPWGRAAMRQLASNVFRQYVAAYGVSADFDAEQAAAVEEQLADYDLDGIGLVRSFIKAYVAELDVSHGPTRI